MQRNLRHRILRTLSDCTGANLVEAALITPLLLTLTFGLIDFATLFYTYLALENGVSQASRFAVTGNQMANPNGGGNLSREQALMSAMRNATPTLALDDGQFQFSHIPAGGSAPVGGVGGPNDVGIVTVTYTWTPVTPILRPFLTNGQIVMKVDSAMKNEGRFN